MLTINEIFNAAGVEQEKKARYFKPEYRTCEHTANFVVAVETALNSAYKECSERERKQNVQITNAHEQHSKMAAKVADLERKLREAEKVAIGSRLETLDITEAARHRIMNTSAS